MFEVLIISSPFLIRAIVAILAPNTVVVDDGVPF